MDSKWDKKYSSDEFVYGKKPNNFLKNNIYKITSGKNILSLGEGEGRNAIHLLKNGFNVSAIDQSIIGLNKATKWAADEKLKLETICDDIISHPQEINKWDGIINIFAHTYPHERKIIHQNIVKALRPGGVYILEAYTREQLNFNTGGPKEIDLFMSLAELKVELTGLNIELGQEIIKNSREGATHVGKNAVVQIIARKKI